ncbi:uncharacterized protein LOC127741881 [Arachis duranensis]|uniref:Uncharacterized protein LOC127741881 n=1 Tax=Arachis duranensis TaxID=130453 RepID=A0A9C6WIA4_ARADU|nr:uncharacterized protein LOC127741881 [Arachis duranensis]
MMFLNHTPSLNLFFSLFQSKRVRRGLWINLSSYPGRALFSLFKSSFKSFKEMFVKIRSSETEYPFFLDDELGENFPLYWCPEPMQVLDALERFGEDDLILDYLIDVLSSGKLLSIAELLKVETDSDGLSEYIGGRVPSLSSANMRSFLEKKREGTDASASKVLKEDNADVAQSSVHPRGEKRKSPEPEGSLEILSGFDVTAGSRIRSGVRRQIPLHEFVSEGSSESVWSNRFPFSAVSDKVGQNAHDVQLLKDVGKEVVGKYMHVSLFAILFSIILGKFWYL